jgi:hypothetical protein
MPVERSHDHDAVRYRDVTHDDLGDGHHLRREDTVHLKAEDYA